MTASFDCSCGRRHFSDTAVIIEPRAAAAITKIMAEKVYQKAFIVSDINTDKAAGDGLRAILNENSIVYSAFSFQDADLVADEKTIGKLLIHFDRNADIIIGLGSGTINDICRFVAFQLKKPYIIIATAPSMDGYCSGVSPLIVNGLKITYIAEPPIAVLCDPDYLKTAPPLMACAGLGDILGKLTCQCDWRLGHLLTGEYYCEAIAGMMKTAVERCLTAYAGGDIGEKSPVPLIEALCLSGTAMAYAGNSRPASGAEHHIAHFWEMWLLAENRPQVLHGIKVAFTTLIVIEIYQKLLEETIDWAACENRACAFSLIDYTLKVTQAFKNPRAAKDIVEADFFMAANTAGSMMERIKNHRENWPAIRAIIKENLPDLAFCALFLKNAGLPESPLSIGIDRVTFINSIIYAKELRNRFTVLQITADLGLLEKYAEQIAETYYEK